MNHNHLLYRKLFLWSVTFCVCAALQLLTGVTRAEDVSQDSRAGEIHFPTSVREARDRAKLLHETIHGTLQVVHRDLFDEDDTFAIPSRSLEDVFEELAERFRVHVRWLVVNTDVLNVDHKPQNDFEKAAVKSLAAGNESFEHATADLFQFAGAIHLKSQCLKCHVKGRTSTAQRTAGLIITMPIESPLKTSKRSITE